MRRKYFLGALFFSFFAVFISSCKDQEELGLEVQPASDQLSTLHTDTVTLITKTIKEDTLRSNGVTFQLLGSYTDPVFGRSDAGFYTQVTLGLLPDFGSSTDVLIPDSLILSLGYAGYYGDTNTTQVVHVYRIGEDMSADSVYYTDKNFNYDGLNDLANNFRFKPAPYSPVSVSSVSQPAQLRIPLPMSLASELLALNGQSTFSSNSLWLQYFKGLYVKTDAEYGTGRGAISYFDLYYSPYSKMTLYFRKITSTNDTTAQTYDFSLSGGVKVNHQEHDYNGSATDVGHQLLDPSWNDSLNYIQSMAGVKTNITLPYLKHLVDSGSIVISKAELVITVVAGSDDQYSPPSKLFLVALNADGSANFLTDYSLDPNNFGGYYNSTTRTYKINVARQIQKILDGKITDYGWNLLISGSVVQATRVVIGSGKNAAYPMKLNLYYTKLH